MKKVGAWRISLLILVLSSLVLVWCSSTETLQVNPLDGYETHIISHGSLQASKYRVGSVKPVQEVVLSPEVWGKLTRFFVDIGDSVKKWATLLKIDSDESATQWAAASSMASALESVKASTAKLFDEQIKSMQHQLEATKKQVEIAKLAYSGKDTGKDDTLRVLEQQKTTAEKTLENLENVYATKEETIIKNTENAFNQASILTNEILNFSDQILWVSTHNEHANDMFENNLSARNTSIKHDAEDKLRKLLLKRTSLETKFDTIQKTLNTSHLIEGKGKQEIIASWIAYQN